MQHDAPAGRWIAYFRRRLPRNGVNHSFRFLASAALAVTLAGCAVPGVHVPPVHGSAPVPANWTEPTPSGPVTADLRNWWTAFDDPALDALVQDALAQNLNLAQAVSRVRQARLQASRAAKQFHPTVGIRAHTLQDIAAIDTYFHASLEMTWELGLFGAGQSIREAGAADAYAAAADAQGVRVAVVADTVRHYLDLKAAQRHTQWLSQLAALDARAIPLAEARLRAQLGSADDILQAHAQAARSLAAVTVPREAATRAAQALALLLGRAEPDPAWIQPTDTRGLPPAMTPFALSVLPADLLRTRPDIHAAEAHVYQAAAALGLARSALYPRIALTGSLLYSYNLTQNFSTKHDHVPALGPVVDIPLFDWGQRKLQITAREEAMNAAILGYRQAVNQGVAEAEGALAGMSAQQTRADALRQALQATRERADASQTRVRLGLSSEYDDLAPRRDTLLAKIDLATAQDAHALAFVALYKALGGAPLPAPDIEPPLDTAHLPGTASATDSPPSAVQPQAGTAP